MTKVRVLKSLNVMNNSGLRALNVMMDEMNDLGLGSQSSR